MKAHYLFEFMDLGWLPSSLRHTLKDILEVALAKPFRPYDADVTRVVLETLQDSHIKTVIEAGAGTAPISRHLAISQKLPPGVHLRANDIDPDIASLETLENKFPQLFTADRDSVDLSEPLNFEKDSLVVLSASFHHIPFEQRLKVLRRLKNYNVLIFEPVNRSVLSLVFSLFTVFPALLTPLTLLFRKPGNLRRFFWCWILPLAPLMIVWDAFVSCMRSWTRTEWEENLNIVLHPNQERTVHFNPVQNFVLWQGYTDEHQSKKDLTTSIDEEINSHPQTAALNNDDSGTQIGNPKMIKIGPQFRHGLETLWHKARKKLARI